jgi:hypothetical protein
MSSHSQVQQTVTDLATLIGLDDCSLLDVQSGEPPSSAAVGIEELQEAKITWLSARLRAVAGDYRLSREVGPHLLEFDCSDIGLLGS